ncbi:cell wall hydrolase [Desulfitibacter alkalitolerans]|uniref:cell wall hydrolase n=1 Tax=Desulfitibacter alkalitolerans TaxID=264641 RepID=UPI000A951403|nr:cell wall hydrolase [Desulfitibacter alkalitolerans]
MKQFLAGLLLGSFLLGAAFGAFSISQQVFQGEAIPTQAPGVGQPRADDVWMISRMVAAEARGEPFQGQVAVAAVIANRVRDPRFPATVNGVIYQPLAFEPIQNGSFWRVNPTADHVRAARYALNGWDPTGGATFFWNPATATSRWIWTRTITSRIGRHVFGF